MVINKSKNKTRIIRNKALIKVTGNKAKYQRGIPKINEHKDINKNIPFCVPLFDVNVYIKNKMILIMLYYQ